MSATSRGKKAKTPLAIVGITLLLTLLLNHLGMFTPLESLTYDHRMRLFRHDAPLNERLAVVLIDEVSLQDMNPVVGRWPWPRSVYADFLEFMQEGGAQAVVFDLLLTENTTAYRNAGDQLNPHDLRLVEASAATGIAYHAAQILEELPDEGNRTRLNIAPPQGFLERFALKHVHSLAVPPQNSIQIPYEGLYQASLGIGMVSIDADSDGVFRSNPLIHNYSNHYFPSLSLVALTGGVEVPIHQDGGRLHVGDYSLPVTSDGKLLINMVGKYRPYSISGILDAIKKIKGGDVENLLIYPDEFAGKIVFVGASAVGLEDVKATALSPRTPGVMLHASTASNILSGDFLVPSTAIEELLIIVILTSITGYGILRANRIASRILIPLLLMALYGAAAYVAFQHHHVYPVAAPMAGITATWLVTFAFLVFTEGKDKRRVRNMLSQYVSPAMLAEVVDRYEDQLQAEVGKRVHLSILFSDVRGFTSFSEKLEAEQVVEMLNIHFRVMTDIIFKYNGTLDKFIGDAIMAFWGAPIRDERHADHSVLSALEMLKGLETVNQTLAVKGYPAIRIGLGINTGDVVLGNIGSEKKLDYTIIGDNVNLGSRLEGLTAKYGCPILISEYTRDELTIDIPCGIVDMVRVKGKTVPIKLFWPMCAPDAAPDTRTHFEHLSQLLNDGFACYMKQDWHGATAIYQQLPDGLLKEIFLERCQNYLAAPPPVDWDGIYTLTEK